MPHTKPQAWIEPDLELVDEGDGKVTIWKSGSSQQFDHTFYVQDFLLALRALKLDGKPLSPKIIQIEVVPATGTLIGLDDQGKVWAWSNSDGWVTWANPIGDFK